MASAAGRPEREGESSGRVRDRAGLYVWRAVSIVAAVDLEAIIFVSQMGTASMYSGYAECQDQTERERER
jgi:hypothetical protein